MTLIFDTTFLNGLNLTESISTTISISNVGGLYGSGGNLSSLDSSVVAIIVG